MGKSIVSPFLTHGVYPLRCHNDVTYTPNGRGRDPQRLWLLNFRIQSLGFTAFASRGVLYTSTSTALW